MGFKIIDRLLVKSFLPPLVATFFIATFILVLQFLWVWIDEIAGKGLGLYTLLELIYFATIRLLPMSIPISVLLAGVMVMGNLGEKNELSSLKSAGVSLLRVMSPLIVMSTLVAGFSYVCSDFIIPYAELKFYTRLYEIRTAKPALNLQPGLFNLDFQGYAIHIRNKKSDGQSIEDVMIYNLSDSNNGLYNYLFAKRGRMYSTEDQNYFIMDLDSVYQVQEVQKSGPKSFNTGPQILRSEFRNYLKVFDMSEFKLTRRDEDNFKNNQKILSVSELNDAIDTIGFKLEESYLRVDYEFASLMRTYSPVLEKNKELLTRYRAKKSDRKGDKDRVLTDNGDNDGEGVVVSEDQIDKENYLKKVNREVSDDIADEEVLPPVKPQPISKSPVLKLPSYSQFNSDSLNSDITAIYQAFAKEDRLKLLEMTKSSIRNAMGGYQVAIANSNVHKHSKRMHLYTLHEKFSLALICIIFLLIGAPMGAIVRKGGFGYSFLIAVIFFVIFIMLTIAFKKITESSSIDPVMAAYMPCIILLPLSIVLTTKAMNDQKLTIDLTWIKRKFKRTSPV